MIRRQNMPRFPTPACSQAPLGASCCCCKRCQMGGCDLRTLDCGCCFHTRCCPISKDNLLRKCSICGSPATGLRIVPMVFDEIDQAQKEASRTAPTNKRGKKRKNATIARLNSVVVSETDTESSQGLRSGRWTDEETDYCDKLIEIFQKGQLPIPDGVKLNDFLSNLLKSKQSRLTKKMKNAKLSACLYKHDTGYIVSDEVAVALSRLETEFFASIKCNMERSEIRFHMQKEWRELFSNYCVQIRQKIDVDDWLRSVEELDRRVSIQNEAVRSARRKVPMEKALEADLQLETTGVFIDPLISPSFNLDRYCEQQNTSSNVHSISSESVDSSTGTYQTAKKTDDIRFFSSTLIRKVLWYMQRYSVPFEHVDVWVPSFTVGASPDSKNLLWSDQDQKCRLLFAGFGVTEVQIPQDGGTSLPMSPDEVFDFLSFGEYSEKFSFDVGCGLPGRVYVSGLASWEQGILNAPQTQFERLGGARQWGIQTVLGVPISSPNVGRVVICFYSRFDRPQNHELVNRLSIELTNLNPTPRWKLVVDVGTSTISHGSETSDDGKMKSELLRLIDVYTPKDSKAPLSLLLPGFTSLRLLLTKEIKTEKEENLITSVMISYASYKGAGRAEADVVTMTARDFMLLTVQTRDNWTTETTDRPQVDPDVNCATRTAAVQPVRASSDKLDPYRCLTDTSCCQPSEVSKDNQQYDSKLPVVKPFTNNCVNINPKVCTDTTSGTCRSFNNYLHKAGADTTYINQSNFSLFTSDSRTNFVAASEIDVASKFAPTSPQHLNQDQGNQIKSTFTPDFFDIPRYPDHTQLSGVSYEMEDYFRFEGEDNEKEKI